MEEVLRYQKWYVKAKVLVISHLFYLLFFFCVPDHCQEIIDLRRGLGVVCNVTAARSHAPGAHDPGDGTSSINDQTEGLNWGTKTDVNSFFVIVCQI